MKPPRFAYLAPATLQEAMALLARHSGTAKLIAGGQSLMPALNFRLAGPDILIDLNRIAELQRVSIEPDGAMTIGAMTRHRRFETDTGIGRHWPLLKEAVRFIAHVQIRNRGTIGGSLCHADPSAEWPALCLACDAAMVLSSVRGERIVPAADFATGLFGTALAPDEILTAVRFPAPPARASWGFEEIARRRGDFAIVGAACRLALDNAGCCSDARLVIFGAGDQPVLAASASAALAGRRLDPPAIAAAAAAARREVPCRSDQQASERYRSSLVETLSARVLRQAGAMNGEHAHG